MEIIVVDCMTISVFIRLAVTFQKCKSPGFDDICDFVEVISVAEHELNDHHQRPKSAFAKLKPMTPPLTCPYCGTTDPCITSHGPLSWLTLHLLRRVQCGVCTTEYYQLFSSPVRKQEEQPVVSRPTHVDHPVRRARKRRKLVS